MAEQEECLLCLKPAFPSVLNHGLLAFIRESEEDMPGEEDEEARPHKRVCAGPSAAVPPEVLSAWQEHIGHLDAAAAEFQVASADGEKLLLEQQQHNLQDMLVQHAEQLERLRCQGKRDVLQLKALRRPAEKEFELAKESALAHVAHMGLPGSVLPAMPEIPKPCVVPRPSAARYTIADASRQYCSVLPGRSPSYFVEGKTVREYADRQAALRVIFRMHLARSWYVHTARVGTSACIDSTFTILDAMEAQVPAADIEACMLPELIAKMDDIKICVTGTCASEETSGVFLMLPSAIMTQGICTTPTEIVSLAGSLPPYDASLRAGYFPSDRCFCGTADCRAPVLAIV
jgi:hypothetical protein